MKRLTLTLGLLALAAVLAACSSASGTTGTQSQVPAGSPGGDAVSIAAKDLKFSQAAVSVKADKAFAIVFDNQEGAPHNVAIADASGKNVFKGDIVSSKQITYQVPALAAGTYAFTCEVHPDMKGTLTAQ